MKLRKENINYFGIFLMIINIFFSIVNLTAFRFFYIFYLGLLISILSLNFKSLKLNKKFFWLLFILLIFVSSWLYFGTITSRGYCMKYAFAILASFVISNSSERNITKCLNLIKNLSIIFMIFTFISLLLPTFYSNIIKLMFSVDDYNNIMGLYRFGGYAGIAGQTGNNALFMSCGLICVILDVIIMKNNKKVNYLLIFLFLLAIILTNKRFFILALAAIIILSIRIYVKNTGKKTKTFIVSGIIVLFSSFVMVLLYDYLPVFDRFTLSAGFMNGRENLYQIAIDLIKTHPYFGIGINNYIMYSNVYGVVYYAHNVFLQLACEIGIPLSIIVIFIIVGLLFGSYKTANKSADFNAKYLLYFSSLFQSIYFLYFFTGNPLYDNNMLFLFFICIGIFLKYNILIGKERKND